MPKTKLKRGSAGRSNRIVLRRRGQFRVDWRKKSDGTIRQQWYDKLRDAREKERNLKLGGYACDVWKEGP